MVLDSKEQKETLLSIIANTRIEGTLQTIDQVKGMLENLAKTVIDAKVDPKNGGTIKTKSDKEEGEDTKNSKKAPRL